LFQVIESTHEVDKKYLEKTAKSVFSYLEQEFEVNLAIVSEKEIAKINKQYRGKNEGTDVLSFKIEDDSPGGDIVIAYEVALRQSEELNLDIREELAFLLVHGMLHLAGYDHHSPKQRVVMESAENDILKSLELVIERQQ
jgi:probable rRNA maturation factor